MRDQHGWRKSPVHAASLTLRGVIARDMVNPKESFRRSSIPTKWSPDDFVFCSTLMRRHGSWALTLKGMITGA